MRLKEIRKSKGISQLKMAMDLNTNQNTISRYETGEREPGINELIKIADYFNVSIDYLLERTKNPNIQKWAVNFTAVFIYKSRNKSMRSVVFIIRGEATPNLLLFTYYFQKNLDANLGKSEEVIGNK